MHDSHEGHLPSEGQQRLIEALTALLAPLILKDIETLEAPITVEKTAIDTHCHP